MQWKQITDFDNYEVSNIGIIRRITNKKVLAFSIQDKGFTSYNRVTLFKNSIRYYRSVHRLVAQAFIPNPKNLPQVNHIDTNGLNNYDTNLEWSTGSDNIKWSFKTNNIVKTAICIAGGKAAAITTQRKAQNKYKDMLKDAFIEFHIGGSIIKDAAVTYKCSCGIIRTASVMWKELRKYKGKCPICTNTVNRSSKSLK